MRKEEGRGSSEEGRREGGSPSHVTKGHQILLNWVRQPMRLYRQVIFGNSQFHVLNLRTLLFNTTLCITSYIHRNKNFIPSIWKSYC